jgi:hypothetical protein
MLRLPMLILAVLGLRLARVAVPGVLLTVLIRNRFLEARISGMKLSR